MDRRPTSIFNTKPVDKIITGEVIQSDILNQTHNTLVTTEVPTVHATIVNRKITIEEVRKLGSETGKGIATIASKVLEDHKNSNSGEMGDKLNDLIKSAKGMSTENFKPGIVGKVLGKLQIMKYDAESQFYSAKDKVEQMVVEFRKDAGKLVNIANSYDDLIKGNALWRRSIMDEIDKAEDMLASVADQMGAYTADALSADEAREFAELQTIHDELEKQIVNLEGFKTLSTMMDPKLVAMKASIYSLENTFDSIVYKMVPAYMVMYADYLNAREANNIATVADKAINTFDLLIKEAGNETAKNMEASAKLRNRQLLSVETLRGEHEKMVTSLNNVRAIEEQARQDRAKAIVEIREIESKTIAALTSRSETLSLGSH